MPDKVSVEYLYYSLLHNQKQLENASAGSSQRNLLLRTLKSFNILTPNSLDEQNKIAFILSKVDELIQKTDQVIEQTQRLKKGLMQRLLTKGIGHTKFKKTLVGDIPHPWNVINMKQIVASYKNGIYKLPEYYGRGVPSIRMFNIKDGKIDSIDSPLLEVTEQELLDYELRPGDILINRVNSKVLVGKAGIVREGLGRITFESKNIRLRVVAETADPYYINYFLNSSIYFRQIGSKTKAAIGQSTINQEDLNNLKLGLPPIYEQQKIASILSKLENKIGNEINGKVILENLKKGLMQKLLTGQLRVKV